MPSNPQRLARLARLMGRAALTPARAVHARIVARLAAQDPAAQARGWTVKALPYGGRSYRDPRFDQLANHAATVAADRSGAWS